MRLLLPAILVFTLWCVSSDAAPYVMEELGCLSGLESSRARAINSAGSIVGTCRNNPAEAKNTNHVFLWKDGQMRPVHKSQGHPACITEKGQVAVNSPGGAYVVDGDKIVPLKTLPKYERSSVYHVNADGVAVGACQREKPFTQCAVFWDSDGAPTRLTLPVKDSFAYAVGINEPGEIVGYVETPDRKTHTFRSKAGKASILETKVKATVIPWDINDAGWIAGVTIATKGATRGFIWKNGKLEQLEPPPGRRVAFAVAISNHGTAVGFTIDAKVKRRACVWTDDVPYELPCPEDARSEAWDINDSGVIVGFYLDAADNEHAVRWVPAR